MALCESFAWIEWDPKVDPGIDAVARVSDKLSQRKSMSFHQSGELAEGITALQCMLEGSDDSKSSSHHGLKASTAAGVDQH